MAHITPHQSLLVRTKVMQNVMPIKLNMKQAAGRLFLGGIQPLSFGY